MRELRDLLGKMHCERLKDQSSNYNERYELGNNSFWGYCASKSIKHVIICSLPGAYNKHIDYLMFCRDDTSDMRLEERRYLRGN